MTLEIEKKLANIVGSDHVTDSEVNRAAYSMPPILFNPSLDLKHDIYGLSPSAGPDFIVRPGSVEEVQKVMRLANQYRIPVIPVGSYTSPLDDTIPHRGGIILDPRRMNHYELDEDNWIITIEAGVTFGQLYRDLAPKGYDIHYPDLPGSCSVMGNSTQRGDLQPIRTSTFSEETLGLEVVLPTGEIVTLGSGALLGAGMYTRYVWGPDLLGIFLGAQGALGVITKQSLPLYRRPERREVISAQFKDIKAVVKAVQKMLDDNFFLEAAIALNSKPALPEVWDFNMSLSGRKERVEFDKKAAREIITEGGTITGEKVLVPEPEETEDDVAYKKGEHVVTGSSAFAYGQPMQSGAKTPAGGSMCDMPVNLPLSQMEAALDAAVRIYARHGFDDEAALTCFTPDRWGKTATMAVMRSFDASDAEERKKALTITDELLQEIVLKMGASLSRPSLPQQKFIIPKLGGYYELIKGVKQMLDPNGIMNPGRFML